MTAAALLDRIDDVGRPERLQSGADAQSLLPCPHCLGKRSEARVEWATKNV